MRRLHPLWRGFWLALSLTVILTLLGSADALAPYRLDRRAMVLAAAVVVGAFFASLPGRLRRRGVRPAPLAAAGNPAPAPQRRPFPWRKCLLSFFCGLAMALALGMAGDGRVLFAALPGSIGAFAFLGTAWVAGFAAVRITEWRART